MQQPEPQPGDIWSLAPVPGSMTTPAPLVLLDERDPRGRWRAWPVFDAGLLVVAPDIRLSGDAAAPCGEAWCAPREVLEVMPTCLGVWVDTIAAPLLHRLRAAAAGALPGDARARLWTEAGDPRVEARREVFSLHRAHLGLARRPRRLVISLAAAAVLAAAATVLVVHRPTAPATSESAGTEHSLWRGKGASVLTVAIIRDGQQLPANIGVRSGDVLSVRYSTRRTRLLVATVSDAPGVVLGDGGGLQITPGNDMPLPVGIALTGQRERLVFLFADRTLELADARRVARGEASRDVDVQLIEVYGE